MEGEGALEKISIEIEKKKRRGQGWF